MSLSTTSTALLKPSRDGDVGLVPCRAPRTALVCIYGLRSQHVCQPGKVQLYFVSAILQLEGYHRNIDLFADALKLAARERFSCTFPRISWKADSKAIYIRALACLCAFSESSKFHSSSELLFNFSLFFYPHGTSEIHWIATDTCFCSV